MKWINQRIGIIAFLCLLFQGGWAQEKRVEQVALGVLKITFGRPDKFTPYDFCEASPRTNALASLPAAKLPFDIHDINISLTARGTVVEIPLETQEQLYGFGLQMNSFDQRGLKKKPVVNAYPSYNLGYSHAPVPFYVSTNGYGILVNTSRYSTFYCGTLQKKDGSRETSAGGNAPAATTVDALYKDKDNGAGTVTVDIPGARGIEVYVFLGPSLKNAVQRYNLFSGGGAMPALWGLGVKYRVKADSRQPDVYRMATYFRQNHIPCDVIGLEPKWQTAAYSCSYVWSPDYFPRPQVLIDSLKDMHFHLNLWEHAFVSPKSPLYQPLKSRSADYLVWGGLVPDLADAGTRQLFGAYHDSTFVSEGVSGFKLDECDNSDITRGDQNWSFPELARFPSGIDGEHMHQLFGILYFRTLYDVYKKRNQRVYFDIRSSNAFASSYPAVLYSDTYDPDAYIRMTVNAGFSGLLWSPEVRESSSDIELIRRAQTSVLAAQTVFDSWYLKNPPWLQYDRDKNNQGILLSNAVELEGRIRKLLDFRMSLIPYLYTAFANYHLKGIPPFRALVMDNPEDKNVYDVSDEYMIGESVLAAPLTGTSPERKVYLPAGVWYDFNTNKRYEGGKTYDVTFDLDQLPLFVKAGSILPLANPVEFIAPGTKFDLTCYVYGDTASRTSLFEDDGISYNFEKGGYDFLQLSWNHGKGSVSRSRASGMRLYRTISWKLVE